MNQKEAEAALLKVGPFETRLFRWHKQVYFSEAFISKALSPLILYFSDEGRLEDWSAVEDNVGPRAPCEMEN
jgi:hypothetical protein